MSPESINPVQIDMAEQARLAVGGAFAEQMQADYLDVSMNSDYAGLDHFGEWYALGAFAETADDATAVYEQHSATWNASIAALVQKEAIFAVQQQTEFAFWQEPTTEEDDETDNTVLEFTRRQKQSAGLLALVFDQRAA